MKKGQAFLALVFLIGAIVAMVGVTLAFLAGSFADTGYGYQALAQAQAAANSGVQDALLQLDRNGSSWNPGTYTLAVGSTTATIIVQQNTPSTGYYTITSSATVSSRVRTVQVVVYAP